MGFGRASAPVRYAQPSFKTHKQAKAGAARLPPRIAALMLLYHPPK